MTTAPRPIPIQVRSMVVWNRQIARETFHLRCHAPAIASRILPGQFVMVRAADRTDPLLARPFALWDVPASSPECIEIVYIRLGNGTRCLSRLREDAALDLWGPLGNTFPVDVSVDQRQHLLLVAGGIGQTPFLATVKEFRGQASYGGGRAIHPPARITLAYGVRSKEYLAGLDDFKATGIPVVVATDDGSAGRRGLVTELVQELCAGSDAPSAVYGCGPEPMLAALASFCRERRLPCWVSLETKMACGYGVCFSCVAPVHQGEAWDYARVCLEGPVFPADQVAWHADQPPSLA